MQGAQLEPQMGSGGYLFMMTQLLALSQGWMVSASSFAALCESDQLTPIQLLAPAGSVPYCTWSISCLQQPQTLDKSGQPPAELPS